MNKNSFSYKKGFKKGIEIYNQNSANGYFADEDNQRVMKRCKQYADSGVKDNQPLKQTQIEFYYGMCDGIEYQYKQYGTPTYKKQLSKFEEREQRFYYDKTQDKKYYSSLENEVTFCAAEYRSIYCDTCRVINCPNR